MRWRGILLATALGLALLDGFGCSETHRTNRPVTAGGAGGAGGASGGNAGKGGKSSSGGEPAAGAAGSEAIAGAAGAPAGGTDNQSAGAGGSAQGGDSGVEGGSGGQAGSTSPAGGAGSGGQPSSCPARAASEVGGPCTQDQDCESSPGAGDGACGSSSNGWTDWPAEGYCLRVDFIACPSDCQDVTCDEGDTCIDLAGCKGCAPACCDGDTCPTGLACGDSILSFPLGTAACVPGNADASDGAPCSDVGDCSPGSNCFSDAFERPGGQCAGFDCTPGDDTTCPAGGHCISEGVGTICADSCELGSDCREDEGYRCVDLGGEIGEVCRHPHTGDICASDADCGAVDVWDCKTGGGFVGGYCTPQTPCPTAGSSDGCSPQSSICYDDAGPGTAFCVDRCPTANGTQSTCRTGYVCVDVDPGIGLIGGCLPP